MPPNLTIEQMLARKSLEQLLADKDLYTPEDAAPLMGYTWQHVHKLCRTRRIERVERATPSGRPRYYLYARTVHGVWKHAAASAARRSCA